MRQGVCVCVCIDTEKRKKKKFMGSRKYETRRRAQIIAFSNCYRSLGIASVPTESIFLSLFIFLPRWNRFGEFRSRATRTVSTFVWFPLAAFSPCHPTPSLTLSILISLSLSRFLHIAPSPAATRQRVHTCTVVVAGTRLAWKLIFFLYSHKLKGTDESRKSKTLMRACIHRTSLTYTDNKSLFYFSIFIFYFSFFFVSILIFLFSHYPFFFFFVFCWIYSFVWLINENIFFSFSLQVKKKKKCMLLSRTWCI